MTRSPVLKLITPKPPESPETTSDDAKELLAQLQGILKPARNAASTHAPDLPARVKRVFIAPSPRPSPPAHSSRDPYESPTKLDNPLLDPDRDESASPPQRAVQVPHEDLLRLFDRLYRSFRQELFAQCGGGCEAIIRRAEQRVRFLDPDFDLKSLSPSTAPGILDLLPAIVSEAPFLKRFRLRKSVSLLMSDLYNNHYDALEVHHLIEKVEQTYYHLKR